MSQDNQNYNPFEISPKFFKFWAIIICLLEVVRVLGFITITIDVTFNFIFLIPVIYAIYKEKPKVENLYTFFIAYLILNIIITDPPNIFNSWFRLGSFLIIILTCSPFLQNRTLRSFRFNCFKYFLIILFPFVLLSFFCFYLGINFMRKTENINFMEYVGAFGGLFGHSMTLGPLAAICTIFFIWVGLKYNKKFFILAILSAATTLFAASRSAVIALLFAAVVLFLTYTNKKTRAINSVLITLIILIFTFPLWEKEMDLMLSKSDRDSSTIYASREIKFSARLYEIESDPLFGVGFAAINTKGLDEYDKKTGVIEPGSSWLGIISMTGIIGLSFFLVILFRSLKATYKSTSIRRSLYLSLLCFFIIHFIAEGYVFSGGNTLCFFFWVLIGCTSDLNYRRKFIKQKSRFGPPKSTHLLKLINDKR